MQKNNTRIAALKGKCKFFNYTKGYGFITHIDKADDYFVHISDIGADEKENQTLSDGTYVTFRLKSGKNGKGPVAASVKKMEDDMKDGIIAEIKEAYIEKAQKDAIIAIEMLNAINKDELTTYDDAHDAYMTAFNSHSSITRGASRVGADVSEMEEMEWLKEVQGELYAVVGEKRALEAKRVKEERLDAKRALAEARDKNIKYLNTQIEKDGDALREKIDAEPIIKIGAAKKLLREIDGAKGSIEARASHDFNLSVWSLDTRVFAELTEEVNAVLSALRVKKYSGILSKALLKNAKLLGMGLTEEEAKEVLGTLNDVIKKVEGKLDMSMSVMADSSEDAKNMLDVRRDFEHYADSFRVAREDARNVVILKSLNLYALFIQDNKKADYEKEQEMISALRNEHSRPGEEFDFANNNAYTVLADIMELPEVDRQADVQLFAGNYSSGSGYYTTSVTNYARTFGNAQTQDWWSNKVRRSIKQFLEDIYAIVHKEDIERTKEILIKIGLPMDTVNIIVRKGMFYGAKNEALKDFGRLLEYADARNRAIIMRANMSELEGFVESESIINTEIKVHFHRNEQRVNSMSDEELAEEVVTVFGVSREFRVHARRAHMARPSYSALDHPKTVFKTATCVVRFMKTNNEE